MTPITLSPEEETREFERLYDQLDDDNKMKIAEMEARGYRPTIEQRIVGDVRVSEIVFFLIH